jgi:hypothetical protein
MTGIFALQGRRLLSLTPELVYRVIKDLPIEDALKFLLSCRDESGFLGLKSTGASTVGTCVNLSGTGFEDNITSAKSKPGFRWTTWV